MTGPAADRLVWVFGFGAVADGPPRIGDELADARLLDGAPVRCTVRGALAAWWTPVPRSDFDEVPLTARLEDPAWVIDLSQRHHLVVASLAAVRTLAPCRFATLYRDAASLSAALDRHATAIAAVLDRVAGAEEWSVKGYARVPEKRSAPAIAGADYLRARVDAERARRTDLARRQAWADGVAFALGAACREVVALTPQEPTLAPTEPRELVFRLACLVPRDDRERFVTALAAAAPSVGDLSLRWSGPLPPYSFAAVRPDLDTGPDQRITGDVELVR